MSVVRFGSSKSPRWKTEQVVLIPHNRSFSPRTPIVAKSFRYYVKMFEFIYTTFPVTAEGKEWFMNFMDYYFSIFTIGGVILHTRCNLLNFLQSAFYQHYSSLFQTKYTLLVLKKSVVIVVTPSPRSAFNSPLQPTQIATRHPPQQHPRTFLLSSCCGEADTLKYDWVYIHPQCKVEAHPQL